jgi:hypothetical protein
MGKHPVHFVGKEMFFPPRNCTWTRPAMRCASHGLLLLTPYSDLTFSREQGPPPSPDGPWFV